MIVMKFGGTSVADAPALRRAAGIVVERGGTTPVVVVSAMGGATRELLAMGKAAADGEVDRALEALAAVVERHVRAVEDLGSSGWPETREEIRALGVELASLLKGIGLLREFGASTRDAVAGFGERMSSPVFASALAGAGGVCRVVDVRTFMITDDRFGDARPIESALGSGVAAEIIPVLEAGETVVTQGYVGRTREGRPTTMGFEASDYTATLLGAALGADEVQIWTDVSGMMTADPRVVPDARPIPDLAFEDAAELALLGAKVLHPRSMAPLRRSGVPAVVKNAMAPDDPGTRIAATAGSPTAHGATPGERSGGVTSIALLAGVTTLRVSPPNRDERLLQEVSEEVERAGRTVRLAAASPLGVTVIVDGQDVPASVRDRLERFGRIELDAASSAVSVVGPGVENATVLGRALATLTGVPVRAVIQGASPHSFSVVVPEAAGPSAVQRLHSALLGRASQERGMGL